MIQSVSDDFIISLPGDVLRFIYFPVAIVEELHFQFFTESLVFTHSPFMCSFNL